MYHIIIIVYSETINVDRWGIATVDIQFISWINLSRYDFRIGLISNWFYGIFESKIDIFAIKKYKRFGLCSLSMSLQSDMKRLYFLIANTTLIQTSHRIISQLNQAYTIYSLPFNINKLKQFDFVKKKLEHFWLMTIWIFPIK